MVLLRGLKSLCSMLLVSVWTVISENEDQMDSAGLWPASLACGAFALVFVIFLCFRKKNVPQTRFTQLLVPVPLDDQTRGMQAGRRRGDGTFDGTSYRNPNTELACPGQLTLLCMFVPVCVKTGTSPVWGVIKDHYSFSPLLHGSMIGHMFLSGLLLSRWATDWYKKLVVWMDWAFPAREVEIKQIAIIHFTCR